VLKLQRYIHSESVDVDVDVDRVYERRFKASMPA